MEKIQETINSQGVRHAKTDITTEEWSAMLADGTITPKQLEALLCIYREPNNEGICNLVAQKYGGTWQFYNNAVWKAGKNVQEHLARFEVVGVKDDGTSTNQSTYWCLLADGRKSKKGFVFMLKPELCKALKGYLYHNLLNVYKQHRKDHSLTDDDELYKWQIVAGCKNKNLVEQVIFTLQYPHQNLIGWRKIADLKPFATNHAEEFQLLLQDLYKSSEDLQSRLKAFFKGLKEHGVDCDERTASVFLTCHSPQQYSFYTDTYYRQFCEYLGEKPRKAGEKYVHFINLLSPLVLLVKNDKDIHQLLASDLNDMVDSPWLIAQDIIYILFTHGLITIHYDIFDWIPFYEELATKILDYKDKRTELASLIYKNFDREKEIKFLHDGDGSNFEEIDPFTVFSIINRSMNCRMDMMRKMKDLFEIDAAVPTSVEGIPVQHPMKASYICFTQDRQPDGMDMHRWWHLFEEAMKEEGDLEDVFNACLQHVSIAIPKLTMGLFYIRPYKFLALDGNNRAYLSHYGFALENYTKMQWADYKQLLQNVNDKIRNGEIGEQTFPEFSASAYNFKSNPMPNKYQKYIDLLMSNHNIILTGAPGTGKTFMAKAIAAEMGAEVGFVQFHPSYDYTDFVEGLRPIHQEGNIGFERKDGVFKSFCIRALQNRIDAKKSKKELSREQWLKIQYEKLLERVENEGRVELELKTNGKTATVIDISDKGNLIFKKSNSNEIDVNCVSLDRLVKLSTVYQCKEDLEQIKNINVEIRNVIKGCNTTFYWAVLHYLYSNKAKSTSEADTAQVYQKDFVFIIDEINRGEISKIFGELFFSVDPGYRGTKGDVCTQYANLQDEPNVFDEVLKSADYGHFFIPDNVYIIGTMNDIDRSVESMDFAMRRRFAWVEVKPEDSIEMLDSLDRAEEAKARMGNLNRAIVKVPGLNEAYQIGAAYFKKMEQYDSFDQLWENHIKGLLSEYLRGNRNEREELEKLHEAFNDTTINTEEA